MRHRGHLGQKCNENVGTLLGAQTAPSAGRASGSGRRITATSASIQLLFVAFERIAHEPQRRRPQTNEKRAPFHVAALGLINRLAPQPQENAQPDC